MIVEKIGDIKAGNIVKRNINFQGIEGLNTIVFIYKKNTLFSNKMNNWIWTRNRLIKFKKLLISKV